MQRLTIGAFARLTHLSVTTLRYYHEMGLLEPAVIDPDSGYRYYLPGQAHSAHLVKRFRDLGVPVPDVKAIVAARDVAARDAILIGHLNRMREQLRQAEAVVDSLRRMIEGSVTVSTIEERELNGGSTVSVAAVVKREDVATWWWDALGRVREIATSAGLEQTGPAGAVYGDELFTKDTGHARVYLPVRDSRALDGTAARWELPAGLFAVAQHAGPHCDFDHTYSALGTYAAARGRDGAGSVRERYLANPLDTDATRWQTELCWPLTTADMAAKGNSSAT